MLNTLRTKLLLIAALAIAAIGIPAVVYLSQQQQDTRSRASASTTLSFTPSTTATAPQQKIVGEDVSFDVMIAPGNNRPSLVKLEILFDATKLQPTTSPFVVNTSAFPATQEGPIVQSGKILISVSVGNDPSKAIAQTTKVGTVNFKTKATTGANTTMISFGGNSQVLSVASQDHASENVLSTTTPAYISIANLPTPTPTNTPPPTSTPIPTPVRKAGDGGIAGTGGTGCTTNNTAGSPGSPGSSGSNTTGGTGGTGGTGCSGTGAGNAGGTGGGGGLGSSSGPGNQGSIGKAGTGTGAGGGGGGGGGGAPGQPGGRGGDGGPGCGGPGQPGLPGEPAPNAFTGGKGGRGGNGGPGCSPTPALSPTQTPTATSTPTSTPNATKFNVIVYMHGIGNSGDNANQTNHSLSNKNPLNKTRTIEIQVLNNANTVIASEGASIIYDSTSGNFKGVADLGLKIPANGGYNIKIKSPTHLRRLVPGVQNITQGTTNNIPAIHVVAGDINNDNALNILDYNILVGCYSDLAPAKSCTTANKALSDLNDDGAVNQLDYNLFLREISVQVGQ
jgi:hypothetical protein